MSSNYWERIREFSQIPPDLLEFVVMPAYRTIGTEFLGCLLPYQMSGYQKDKFYFDFEARAKELLHGTIYRFTPRVEQKNPNELIVDVWELILDV